MRTSIVKFDYEALNERILEYHGEKGYLPFYVVMSKETLDVMRSGSRAEPCRNMGPYNDRVQGINVAICNAVPFGQVDIV